MFQYGGNISDRPSQPTTMSSTATSQQPCRPAMYSIPRTV